MPSPLCYLTTFWMLPTTRTFDECFCPVRWGGAVHVIRLMECGGSIGASELRLIQQYNRGMEVGTALKQRAFWVAGEQCSIGLLDRSNTKVN